LVGIHYLITAGILLSKVALVEENMMKILGTWLKGCTLSKEDGLWYLKMTLIVFPSGYQSFNLLERKENKYVFRG